MRIENLRLKGFIGIKRGLGLDEISIDFSGISGLIAFEGMNGAGKSTILENLHPYNQLASRDGALYRHVCRRDSEKELSFEYAGNHYRTLLKIDCDSGKSEGFIWKDGQSEVNGKISAYAEYIKNLLGSPVLFFSSVFCAQNSKKISDMTTGQLKGLFAEFLRLDRLTGYEETAKQCGNVLGGSVGQIESRIKHLNDTVSAKAGYQERLKHTHLDIAVFEAKREDLKQRAAAFSKRIDELKEIAAQNAVNVQRKQDLVNALERIQKDLDSDRLKNNDELTSLRSDYQETNQELVRLNAILADRDAIEGAAAKEKELTATIEGLTIEIDKLTEQGAGHQELIHDMENAIRDLEGSVHALSDDLVLRQYKEAIREQDAAIRETEQFIKAIETDAHIIRLESDINNLEEKASILDLKDPSCQSKTCAFITNALTAAERLPVLKKTLASLKVRQAENIAAAREKLDGLNEHFKDLTNREIERIAFIEEEKGKIELKIAEAESKIKAEKLLSTTRSVSIDIRRKNLSDAKSELNQQKALSARLSEIQVAEQRSEDVVKRLDEITQKGIDARKAFEVRELEAKRLISEHQEAITGIDEKIDQDADVKLSGYQKEMNAIETDLIPVIDKEIQETREKSAKIQGELSRIEDAEKELATVQAEKERLTREISEWAYLRNACSKNGLQALEIDGAAPLITGYANDLLSQAFGPLFTVRLRTQDDEGKEVLDIVVIMDDGSEVLLDNLSGGQKIWILMALRLAMTLLSKEKSGRNFETALFDEIDGPLDPDNSVNFIAMYQAFMKTGGFTTIPFISHKPECRSMADNILRFEPGKNPVWG